MIRKPNQVQLEAQLLTARSFVEGLPGGEDLFQTVCLKCINQGDRRNWGQNQQGFIRKVARCTSIDMFRSQKTRESFWGQVDVVDPACRHKAERPLASASREEQRTLVRERIASLAEPYRSTVVARYFRDQSADEIAHAQGIPVNTVRTRLKRALQKLQVSELKSLAEHL